MEEKIKLKPGDTVILNSGGPLMTVKEVIPKSPFNPKKVINLILLWLINGCCFSIYAQSYLAEVTQSANLRQGPGMDQQIIQLLPISSQVFVYSLISENEFYRVIHVETNLRGYVHKSLVRIIKEVNINPNGVFVESGRSSSEYPELEIYNDTDLKLTLELNNDLFYFIPQERKVIFFKEKYCNYIASAPGVIPCIGNESFASSTKYDWTFYISTVPSGYNFNYYNSSRRGRRR